MRDSNKQEAFVGEPCLINENHSHKKLQTNPFW